MDMKSATLPGSDKTMDLTHGSSDREVSTACPDSTTKAGRWTNDVNEGA